MVDNKDSKNADLLASDAIMNYRTVIGFGLEGAISKEYSALIETPFQMSQKSAHISGIVYGYS
jgi:ABC-type transport system involved in Fe-S cluster assembly fused permease/ATPase subunit